MRALDPAQVQSAAALRAYGLPPAARSAHSTELFARGPGGMPDDT